MQSTLSIDSKCEEVVAIILSIQSRRKEVIAFLDELRRLLDSDEFDMTTDFSLVRSRKEKDEKHSTPYTLLTMSYSEEDVIERIRELTLEEYSETLLDKDNTDSLCLFVFGKTINKKLIYVKLKKQ